MRFDCIYVCLQDDVALGIVNFTLLPYCSNYVCIHTKKVVCFSLQVIMALKTDKLTFLNDIEFCPMCAAILPLPGKTPFIKCYMCPFKVPIEGKYILVDFVIYYPTPCSPLTLSCQSLNHTHASVCLAWCSNSA